MPSPGQPGDFSRAISAHARRTASRARAAALLQPGNTMINMGKTSTSSAATRPGTSLNIRASHFGRGGPRPARARVLQ